MKHKRNAMEIKQIKIEELRFAEYNPRSWTEKAVRDLTESIKRFGLVDPIIVNRHKGRENIIIGGHFRCKIARDLGIKEVPVYFVDLDEQGEKELNLRLNRNTGGWDYELLEQFDKDLLFEAGWEKFEIEDIFEKEIAEEYGKLSGLDNLWKNDTGNPDGDGIRDLVGYDLLSVWDIVEDCNTRTGRYFLPLPINRFSKSRTRFRYSRTHPCEIEKVVKTYMRKGDYFLESCVGWATFSSVAKFYGYSGIGIDIWDESIEYCKKQLAVMPGKGKVDIKRMDATKMEFEDNIFDIIYCNPPFFNLESYSGLDEDLAKNKNYDDWIEKMKKMTSECFRVLKTNGLAIFTMADFRKNGLLINAHSDWIKISQDVGFSFWDHAIEKIKSLSIGMRKRNYKKRQCVKAAEHILVFKKIR